MKETVLEKIERKEELSKIEKSLKSKSDRKLKDTLESSFRTVHQNFDCVNTFMPKELILKAFESKMVASNDSFRLNVLLRVIVEFLFDTYQNKYYNEEVDSFINKTDQLQQELDELKSQVER